MTISRYAPHSRTAPERALGFVGETYPDGWCLRFAATDVLGVPGTTDWSNTDADCHDFWDAAVLRGTVIETDDPDEIPAHSLAIWSGDEHGHAAFALGEGEAVGTSFPTLGKIGRHRIADLTDAWGHTLLGAITVDGNGYIYAPRPDDFRRSYEVANPSGAQGFTSPTSGAQIGAPLDPGTVLEPDELVQHQFRQFARVGDVFYPFKDLRRLQ